MLKLKNYPPAWLLSVTLKYQNHFVLFLLTAVTIFAFFVGINQFGMYEDDYALVGLTIQNSFSQMTEYVSGTLSMRSARPLQYAFPALVGFLTGQISDSLFFAYSLGSFFIIVNSFLLFILLRKWVGFFFAFMGSLFFLLSPADSTKILLTHNLILQPSITLALLALLLFLKPKLRMVSYFVAAISLLFYESPFLIFLFAPFFVRNEDVKFTKVMKHFVFWVSIVLFILISRKALGETRVSEMSFGVIATIIKTFIYGPHGSAKATVYGLYKGAKYIVTGNFYANFSDFSISNSYLLFFIVMAGGASWILNKFVPAHVNQKSSAEFYIPIIFNFSIVKKYFAKIKKAEWNFSIDNAYYFLALGTVMLPLSYAFAFTHYPPTAVRGRMTSVHLAATVSWGIFLAGFVNVLYLKLGYNKLFKIFTSLLLGVFFSLCFFYALYVQQGYIYAWNAQKNFWGDLEILLPDMDDKTVILADGTDVDTNPANNRVIQGASWALPYAFDMYYGLPKKTDKPKPVFRVPLTLQGNIQWLIRNEKIVYLDNGPPAWGSLIAPDEQTTVFISRSSGNKLIRVKSMSLMLDTSPVKFRQSEGITYFIESSPRKHRETDYIVTEYLEAGGDNIKINNGYNIVHLNFKYPVSEAKFKSNHTSRGILHNFIHTGKFGLPHGIKKRF